MLKNLLKNLPWQSLPVIIFLIISFANFQFFMPDYANWLEYNQANIQQGEYWRLLSAHFLHSNLNHFLMNSAGLLALWTLHGHYYSIRPFLNQVIIACVAISAYLYWFTDIQIYVGFSGVLHCLIAWGALTDIQKQEKTGYLLIFALIAKVIWEQVYGASASTAEMIEASVAIEAHLAGLIMGFVIYGYEQKIQQKNLTQQATAKKSKSDDKLASIKDEQEIATDSQTESEIQNEKSKD